MISLKNKFLEQNDSNKLNSASVLDEKINLAVECVYKMQIKKDKADIKETNNNLSESFKRTPEKPFKFRIKKYAQNLNYRRTNLHVQKPVAVNNYSPHGLNEPKSLVIKLSESPTSELLKKDTIYHLIDYLTSQVIELKIIQRDLQTLVSKLNELNVKNFYSIFKLNKRDSIKHFNAYPFLLNRNILPNIKNKNCHRSNG
jgi:hypothetical protein